MKYSWISTDEAVGNAERAIAAGAERVCLVASGRGPADRHLVVEGAHEQTLPEARHDLVTIRRRGAGSDVPAKA